VVVDELVVPEVLTAEPPLAGSGIRGGILIGWLIERSMCLNPLYVYPMENKSVNEFWNMVRKIIHERRTGLKKGRKIDERTVTQSIIPGSLRKIAHRSSDSKFGCSKEGPVRE